MSTPVGKVQRESVSFPVVTEDFCIVHLATAGGAGANLVTAIQDQIALLGPLTTPARTYPSMFKSIVISASSGNDIIIGGTAQGGAGIGIKIAAGTSMLLGFSGTPADPLLYQCAGVCAVAVYF
tara:strand:+ start:428 stop:799 length:372 start_codon:yes stop_codon:yes gene_type:complete